jgi:hypothetical protein
MLDHSMLAVDTEDTGLKRDTGTPPTTWVYICFNNEKLAHSKELALSQESHETCQPGISPAWISTDEAITAFLWQRITLPRHLLPMPRSPSHVAQATVLAS